MAKSLTVKPEEQHAREYADRLILAKIVELQAVVKLSEIADRLQDSGLGLAAVRSLLASNPDKFAYSERRWVPASRVLAEGRPALEQARLIVERFGGPMPFGLLLNELNLTRPEVTEETLRRMIDRSPSIVLSVRDDAFLSDWCFTSLDESVAEALDRHRISTEEFTTLGEQLEGTNWRDRKAIEQALENVSPVSAKLFGAVAWSHLNPQDPHRPLLYHWKRFYAELFGLDGFVFSPSGMICPEADTKRWINTALKIADKLSPTVEIEDAAPIEVKAEDVDRMVKKILASETSVTTTRILEEFYEITPTVKTFPDDMANVMDALRARKEVVWVGGDRFNKADVVPELVQSVPEIFEYVPTPFEDEEGDQVDAELSDEGLSSTLRKLLNHPLATDVLDEDIMPAQKQIPESIRCVLKSIHREIGTFPLCQIPTGWFGAQPDFQEIILIDQDGRELTVWANMRDRLIFGLIDWFYEQPVESGAVFSLTKTGRPNVYDFEWLDQTDPVVFITAQRMEELREIQSRAEEMSTYDVLREVMVHWPKGADFLTLLWETNVVRRSSRRLIASLLSSYACFYQRSGSPVWHYDSKKVEQGFDKTKKKFILKR